MNTNHIILRPGLLNFPLAQCTVGKLSSAVFEIGGGIPDDVASLSVQIERPSVDGVAQPNFAAAARNIGANVYRVYFSPFYFPEIGCFNYHVIATDESGNPRWLGSGTLCVLDNPANGAAVAPEIIPSESYAYNPQTGLYHKMTAVVDEYGEITIEVAQEGVQR